jgi:ADP-heptose:LPS heptosyltransferase
MKILIISTNALGDTYLSATALSCLNAQFKEPNIDFIVSPNAVSILAELRVNKVFLIEKTITCLLKNIREIRKNKYDYVFTFFPGVVNSFFLLFSKARTKSGFLNVMRKQQWYNKRQRIYSNIRCFSEVLWEPEMNYIKRIELVLENAKINTMLLSKEIRPKNKIARYNPHDKIIVHPFSRDKERSLPNRLIKTLCEYLLKNTKMEVKIIGISSEFDAELLEYCKSKSIQIIMGMSFREICQELLSSKLFIGVDSFLLHIADGYNLNLIGIFSCTNPKSVMLNFDRAINFSVNSFELITNEKFLLTLGQYKTLFIC